MSVTVDYYFTTSSPWTYLGSSRFIDLADQIGATVNVYPVAFGEIFQVSGGLPLPKRAPQRQAYRMMELKRWRDYLGIPLILEPKNFPSTAPISNQMIIAARKQGQDALALSHAILSALWAEDRNIDDPTELAAIGNATGLDGSALVEAAAVEAETYAADTKKAIAAGVFGAPSWVLPDGEIFWGQDRFELLRWRLGG
ncbi:MAG: 2-hydroxychromene-2-carboxylate isomerase [Alphaproteobacteria bacterium]|nr:2-hydroxychromene-2-carboxylate isomerase [Alphaproteobacteria bacterium]